MAMFNQGEEWAFKMSRDLREKDARIAELTTEVADLKSRIVFLESMESDQTKTVAELTAEVDKSRRALLKIREVSFANDSNEDYGVIYNIARNALKDGV